MRAGIRRILGLAACGAASLLQWPAVAQSPPPPKRPPEVLQRLSIEAEKPGLAQPYLGINSNGKNEPGLFKIQSTGVSTAPVRKAAEDFKWMNQSFYVRQGVSFQDLSSKQRDRAFALLRSGLSAKGFRQTRDIMRLNETLAELTSNFDEYGEWQYYITIMGTPSATEPWGWQLDGHHAIINYFVLGDQVVMTPFFAGSEPVIAPSGKYKGTKVLQLEQDRGLGLVNSMNDNQRRRAVLNFSKTGDNNLTEAWKDNVVLDYAGIPYNALDYGQRDELLGLIELYVNNMDDGHAKVKMSEVRAHLDRTYFAWIGKTDQDSVFYYRIHSPVLLIEFDHQRPVGIRHLLDPAVPNRAHIHTVVRTPNGNDYGKDLLRQHYAQQPH
jgi:hypothetical protein